MSNYFVEIYKYNCWANRKVWDCAEEDYLKPLDYSIGAIFVQLVHTMGVEYWWMHFLQTGELKFIGDDTPYRNRQYFREQWDTHDKKHLAFLESLTPTDLERLVRPDFWEEQMKPIKVWQAIHQVMIHSTDHRAQTLAMLYQLNAPTTGQDYLDYLHK
jgi:uncharacterized damage-inducible protein DinB